MSGHATLQPVVPRKWQELADLVDEVTLADLMDDVDDYDFIDWRVPMSPEELEARRLQSAYVNWKRKRGRTITRPMLDAMTAAHRLDDREEARIENADRAEGA